jgi:formylglycine-generating enzyme required for sulfatase activity
VADAKTSTSAQNEPTKTTEKEPFDPWRFLPWIIAGIAAVFGPILGCIFMVYRYRRRIPEEKEKETAKREAAKKFEDKQEQEKFETLEDRYKKALREEVSWIKMLGSPDIPNLPVHLLDTFVSLRISESWRSETRFDLKEEARPQERERDFTPEQIMQRAFANRRMLLIIGDPGSGKTTLMKYYAMCCMSPDRYKRLGFEKPPLPVYFPMRQVHSDGVQIASLPKNLARWAKEHTLSIDEKWFENQLNQSPTLVLLDGLDEIGDIELRRRVCDWIDNTAEGLDKAMFVVTSRWTGYRKSDLIEIGFPHLRADVRDFSTEQQEEFLNKWFCAAFLEEQYDDSIDRQEWKESQKQRGLKRAKEVIDFLREDKNKGVQGLVAIPMLLQIIAVIWKEREVLPRGRAELYRIALKYLLDYRDRRRRFDPLLTAEEALRVLCPVSLWMQEELRADEVERDKLHKKMQPIINTINDKVTAKAFCENLRDRAGIVADYGESAYIFRHKSFREYLAALGLVDDAKRDKKRLKKVVQSFGDDWWEEPLRFFINEADDRLFDEFMDALFASDVSKELDQKQQNLLHTITCEATQVRVDSLVRRLNDGRVTATKKRYILDCLKAIDKQEARRAVSDFASKEALTSTAGIHAIEIEMEMELEAWEKISVHDAVKVEISEKLPGSLHNRYEYNAEYILIPGGRYKYQGETETNVPSVYFAKYPVTNKRYRRFIRYLQDSEPGLAGVLPKRKFNRRMTTLISEIKGLSDYLGDSPYGWPDNLRSDYDAEKRFDGVDQPVVGISWFAARAYCCWLSLLETADADLPPNEVANLYRLPTELEWEWASGGGTRQYPWSPEKGLPSEKLANYENNVGATTPVGRYPDGATPEGMMDMAGNVWEWMGNWHEKFEGKARSLRGGSWDGTENNLRCSYRHLRRPVNHKLNVGFRVVRSQS